jgi:LEA14-like dessication related protein
MGRGTSAMARHAACGAGARAARTGAVAACALLVAACVGLPLKPLPPKVEIAGVRLLSLQPADLRLRVLLKVDNPNAYPLDIDGIDAVIAIHGVRLADARLPAPVSLAPSTVTGVELEMRTRLDLLANALERGDGTGRVPYEVTGTAALRDGVRLPFSRRGEMPVGDWLPGRRR